jgi:glycosyltransferase involved in cell wall biosynthesis
LVSEHASPLAPLKGVDAGGQNVHVAALAQYVARQGHHVEVFTRKDSPALADLVHVDRRVSVRHVPAGPARPIPKDDLLQYMDAFGEFLLESWSARPPDVVHSHFWMSGYAAIRAAEPLGIPVVHTYHALGTVKRRYQGAKDTSPPSRLAIEQSIGSDADRIIATCSDEVAELARMEIDPAKTWIIPCGVDLELFTPDGERWPNPSGRPRLVAAGRLVERKGFADAIAALTEIEDAELMVVGGPESGSLEDDAEARRLRDLASELGVADRVRMAGSIARAEMPSVFRSADAVLCVPWYEPFGIVPLEAMACGTPVVAAATGGQIDSVAHMETGIHVTPRSTGEISAAVNLLLGDRELRRRCSANAVRRARERFDWELVATSTLHVYAAVLRTPRCAATVSGQTGDSP